MLCALPR